MTLVSMTAVKSRCGRMLLAAALAATVGTARAELFVFAFTGHVTSESVFDGAQLVQGPHIQNGGEDVSGTFSFDPTLAPFPGSSTHTILHNSGSTTVSFVSSVLHFAGGDAFIPVLTQAPQVALDYTQVQDEDGDSDSILFRDGESHSTADGQQTDEQAYLQLSIAESDPAIHDLVKAPAYGQTPDQALVQQFGQGSYFYSKIVPTGNPGEFKSAAYTFGTFSLTSLTLIPEPAPVLALLSGCILMIWVVRRASRSHARS